MIDMDDDAIVATLDLVGRTGARELQYGYLHEDVPLEQAGWYAHAQYQGVRVTVEDHRGPVEALEALARRLLTGAKCTHCGGLVALGDTGAVAYPGSLIGMGQLQGIKDAPHAADEPWDEETIRAAGQCRWRRMGPKWVRGCEGDTPPASSGPNRATRRAKSRRKKRQ